MHRLSLLHNSLMIAQGTLSKWERFGTIGEWTKTTESESRQSYSRTSPTAPRLTTRRSAQNSGRSYVTSESGTTHAHRRNHEHQPTRRPEGAVMRRVTAFMDSNATLHVDTDGDPFAVGETVEVIRGNGPRTGDRMGTATVIELLEDGRPLLELPLFEDLDAVQATDD